MLRLENVGLRYGDGPEILRDVSFAVHAGDFYFLTGPSGAGKSSLLKLLFLALRPTRGSLHIFGENVGTLRHSKLPPIRHRIGVVFQEFRLVHGTWDVRNPQGKLERVRPQDITSTAHLTVEGELDDISGSGQTEAVHALCTGVDPRKQRHFEAKGAGHYGIFAGRSWRNNIRPLVLDFIDANAGEAKPQKPKIVAA